MSSEAPASDAQGTPAAAASWTLYSDAQRRRLLLILFLVSTSNFLDRNILSVLLEPIKHEFVLSDTMLGLLGGFMFAVFYALFGLPVARLADRGNRRTIITVALTVWSIATVACGLAQTFWQLALARIGVGAGESGAIPPAQSLIADYYPPERRAGALGIFLSSATAGLLLGISAGGWIAAHYGWRTAFVVAGAPGLLLAVVTATGLSEPRQRLGFPAGAQQERTLATLRVLLAKRSYRAALVGCILYYLYAYGAVVFMPSFLVRVLHVPLAQVGVAYGATGALGSLLGTLAGGWLADRASRRDVRGLAFLPAAACALSAPLWLAALSAATLPVFLALSFVAGGLLAGGLPPVFAAIHTVCGNRRRATAIAIARFSATLAGGGCGPLLAGALSDALSAHDPANGLRWSLMLMTLLLLAAAACFTAFGRAMPQDLEE